MTLDPHHLQQWDRSTHAAIGARVSAICRYDWGLTHLDIDEDRLANGEFVIRGIGGVMSDGLAFRFPDDAACPAPRDMRDGLAPTAERVRVHLAIPALRTGGTNVSLEGGAARRETRYVAEEATIIDENTGADQREIRIATLAARVVFDGESREDTVTIPIADVIRASDGSFALAPEFVPPSLRIGASRALGAISNRVTERLAARTNALASRWQAVRNQREISPGDVTAQALLAATAEYAPRIDHVRRTEAHPTVLFGELLGLAGRLWAAAPGTGPAPHELPQYDHAEPTAAFSALSAAVEQLLGGKAPRQNYVRIAMVQSRPNLFEAALTPEVLASPGLVFTVRRNGSSPEQLKVALPQMLRIASPDTIEAVIRSYTHALVVDPMTTPPSGLPVDPQAAYFQPRRSGPFWDAICEAGAVALFSPAEYADAEFEILAPQPG